MSSLTDARVRGARTGPGAAHVTDHYANNSDRDDHGRLKAGYGRCADSNAFGRLAAVHNRQLQAGSVRADRRSDPGQGLRGVHPVRVRVTGTDGVGDERVDREDDVGAPSRLGPPESPKQVPPLFECSLMNSSLMELLLATKLVDAKNRVVASPGCFLHGPPHGPPPLTKFCTP
jgi:hypothetical protein